MAKKSKNPKREIKVSGMIRAKKEKKPAPKARVFNPIVFSIVQGQDKEAYTEFFKVLGEAGYKVEKLDAQFGYGELCTVTFKITKG